MKKSHLLGAVCAGVFCLTSLSVHAAPVSGQGTWETTLEGRDLDGDASTFEAYYDTVLDISWLTNADVIGAGDWNTANTWATTLDVNGVTGWRLPITGPINGVEFQFEDPNDPTETWAHDGSRDRGDNISAPGTLYAGSTASEFANMFYNSKRPRIDTYQFTQ